MSSFARYWGLPVVVLALCAGCQTGGGEYGKSVEASMKRTFGDGTFDNYVWQQSPGSGFGVLTFYNHAFLAPWDRAEARQLLAVSDDIFAHSVPAAERKALLESFIVKETKPAPNLSDLSSSNVSLEAAAPNLYQLVNANGSVNTTQGVKLSYSATSCEHRRVAGLNLVQALKTGKIRSDLAKLIRARDVIFVDGDVTLIGYRTRVELDRSANSQLDAALSKQVGQVLGANTGLRVKVEDKGNGVFELVAVDPVIVGKRFRRPGRDVFGDFIAARYSAEAAPVTLARDGD